MRRLMLIFLLSIISSLTYAQAQAPAQASVDSSISSHSRNVQAKFEQATHLAQQGLDEAAIQALQVLIQQYPELPEPYNNLAALYAKRGQYEQARPLLETAIRVNPGYSLAYQNLGSLYLQLAATAYQQAIRLNAQDKFSIQRQRQIQAIISETSAPPAQ